MTTSAPIVSARDLSMVYGSTQALAGVDLDIFSRHALAITGPSGSGKSTLLHVLAGVQRPQGGTVHLDGERTDQWSENRLSTLRRTRFGFVFQSGQLLDELTAVENVALPLMLNGQSRKAAVATSGSVFAQLGIEGLQDRRPGTMSGGQAQRVAIARALITEPAVVFADEPTGALDQRTGAAVLALLIAATKNRGAALVVVTHDRDVAAACDRHVSILDGILTHQRGAGEHRG